MILAFAVSLVALAVVAASAIASHS